jgi:hypothetical protein
MMVAFLTASAAAQGVSQKEFDEFRKSVAGRWIGQVKWVTDWPGIGKKGDVATCYLDISEVEGGHAMIGKFYGGSASGTMLWAFNTGEKTITGTVVYSSGLVENLTYRKEDGTWVEIGSGTLPDGRKTESKSKLTFEDEGAIMRARGTGTVDGKPNDPRDDKWQRLR